MRYSNVLVFVVGASAHGVILKTIGVNGVIAPGACVLDGTPRDCIVNACGAQADTAIIRDFEISRGSHGPLGWTQGHGDCAPLPVLLDFMGNTSVSPNYTAGRQPTGQEDNLAEDLKRRESHATKLGTEYHTAPNQRDVPLIGWLLNNVPVVGPAVNDAFDGLSGGISAALDGLANLLGHVPVVGGLLDGAVDAVGDVFKQLFDNDNIWDLPIIGVLGIGGERTSYPSETVVSDLAGLGNGNGLPTTSDAGEIALVWRQINEDGAGPLDADIDPSSCGTDYNAFQKAEVTQDVPGVGFSGLSIATNTNFNIKVKMPEGMVCNCNATGADGVCFVRVRNRALAGPFGGTGFFTQSHVARKRAVNYRLRRRSAFRRRP